MSEIRFNGVTNDIIHDLSLTIKENTITALSGDIAVEEIGKIIIGLSTLKDGSIEIFNKIINKDNYKRSAKKIQKECVYVVNDTSKYLQNKTVKNEFIFNYKYINKRYNELETIKYLELLGLSKDILNQNPLSLNIVDQKKVIFASMLIMNPEILIFDNIDKHLDIKDQLLIKRIIIDLKKQGRTIILITNNTNFYCDIVDRILVINNSEVIADGDKNIFFENDELSIDEPEIVSFIKRFNAKNSKKLYQTFEFNDLLKDIYRLKSDIQR